MNPFASGYEILAVFHKAAPACNYAQTAAQAALALSGELRQRGLGTSAMTRSAYAPPPPRSATPAAIMPVRF